MAVFLLRAWFDATHTPPTPTQAELNQFNDIGNSFAKDWIIQLVDEGITRGCGDGNYCPAAPVTRGQMAALSSGRLIWMWIYRLARSYCVEQREGWGKETAVCVS